MYVVTVNFKFLLKIFLLLASFSGSAFASDLERKIEKIISATGEDLNIGIYVKGLNSNEVKFATHENRRFVPASTTKLFTSYAALKYLGRDFRYRTAISADKIASLDAVDGNIYVRFSGDPTLSYKDIKNIMRRVGAKDIKGNLVINDHLFDHHRTSPGGFAWDDKPFCYAAPKSAIIINGNCSEAKMWPGSRSVGRAKLEIQNPRLLNITNNVETVNPRKQQCPYESRYLGENTYEVYGCMFSNIKKPIRLNFALPDNRRMAKSYFEKALKENGMKLNGRIIFSNNSGRHLLYTHQSAPLRNLIIPLLHDSLNPDSASLFKYMGYKYTGKQGSDESGENMMNRFLRKAGLKNGVILKDGSGESRYNLITPKALVSLLDEAYKSEYKDSFIAAIPKYGSDSTVRYRNISSKFNRYIRAKTGSMRDISSLAGYYLPSHGKKYAFAVMINGHGLPSYKAKELEDKILNVILSS